MLPSVFAHARVQAGTEVEKLSSVCALVAKLGGIVAVAHCIHRLNNVSIANSAYFFAQFFDVAIDGSVAHHSVVFIGVAHELMA